MGICGQYIHHRNSFFKLLRNSRTPRVLLATLTLLCNDRFAVKASRRPRYLN